MPAFVAGNDDTFAVLMFGFNAFICFLLVIEAVVRHKAYLHEIKYSVAWCKQVLGLATTQPKKLKYGYELLKAHPEYTKKHVYPLWTRILYRWRWVCWLSCLVLFFIVAYQKMSFDPYETLNVPMGADEKTIKKAYKKLVKLNHPDVNKTEAAKWFYPRIKKAKNMLLKPDDDSNLEMLEGEEQGSGVAMPSFLTHEDSKGFAVAIMLLLLFGGPLFMLFRLKRNQDRPEFIPLVTELAKNIAEAEKFIARLGGPRNEIREYEEKSRPVLTEALKKLAPFCYIPNEELPFMPVDVSAHFRPEICSVVELKGLLMDIAFADPKKGPKAELRLGEELCLFIHPHWKMSLELQKVVKDMKVTEKDEADFERYEEMKEKGVDFDADYKYTTIDDGDAQVVNYFLFPLLNLISHQTMNLYQPIEGIKCTDMAKRLHQLLTARFDHFKLLKRQQAERTAEGKQLNKLHRESLNKSFEHDQNVDRLFYELVTESKARAKSNLRRQRTEYEKRRKEYEKFQKKSKNRSAS